MTMFARLALPLFLCAAEASAAITIGAGPIIGTNKNSIVTGSAIWYQEFQDWGNADLRGLDTNADTYNFGTFDTSRDIVAAYSRIEGDNVYFRIDFFDIASGAWSGQVDVYLAIDCAAGGKSFFLNSLDTNTDHPWELMVMVYDNANQKLEDKNGADVTAGNWLGSYWHGSLDSVEFGIKKSVLTGLGWDGTSAMHLQVATAKDATDISGRSDLVDVIGSLTPDAGGGIGLFTGGVTTTSSTGRAKYAAIAHANQSVAPRTGTQGHIFTDRSDIGKYPGFVRLLDSAEFLNVPMNLHISGTLLMSFAWAAQNPAETGLQGYPNRDGPTFLNRVKRFVTTGPGSLVGGVLAEHIMPYFEGDVNRKSIQQNNELVQSMFGLSVSNMGVMHIPERVFHTNTNSPYVNPNGPIKGKPFEDILAGGFDATYLDEVTHLHWWFYPNESTNPGWDDGSCGRWAGGLGNDEEPYHHKVHKINGVYCFMINDREDQEKFGNDDGGMMQRTRFTLLQKALHADYAQITIVFDDWEAFAGNSFASSTPNDNADQWDRTIRWAANHPWIEIVNLKDILGFARGDSNWVVDHGTNNFNHSSQTYEWLKRASEQDYDHWYYGSGQEQSFFARVPQVVWGFTPGAMKKYGDMNTTNTLIRDSWDRIQSITSTNLKKISEWSYSAMIYETAWHDEDANPDQYKSRNYQVDFNRSMAQGNCDDSVADTTYDNTSGWALRLHGHVRDMGVMKAASDWVQNVKNGSQGAATTVYAADIDDDQLWEYVLCNNKVFLCFERWGARLVKAFVYDPNVNGGDAIPVVGVPISNPPEETENEGADNNRCSVFKDRWCTVGSNTRYIDGDYALTAPTQGSNYWEFTASDGGIRKRITLPSGRDVVGAEYWMNGSAVGTLYARYGFGPNQFDLMMRGASNLVRVSDASFRGVKNTQGGEAYVVAGRNVGFTTPNEAQWGGRELPLTEQYETGSTATNWTVWVAFSETSARDVDGDGLSNTNEMAIGTNHERADTDSDGMPDGYEVANSLLPLSNDAGADADGDRVPNGSEYVANTGANNSNSYLRVTNVMMSATGNVITYPIAPPRVYSVLFADGLGTATSWQAFGNTNPPIGSFLATNPAQVSSAFTDDYTAATSGGQPTNGLRVYTIKVGIPE